MIIEPEIKLDFKDVLIRPKRSTLTTRKEVDLSRKFSFVNAKLDIPYKGHELIPEYSGIPIMASNMDGVGTFSMAKILQKHQMMTVITKSTSVEQWREAVGTGLRLQSVSVCTGTNKIWDPEASDYKNMQDVLSRFTYCKKGKTFYLAYENNKIENNVESQRI